MIYAISSHRSTQNEFEAKVLAFSNIESTESLDFTYRVKIRFKITVYCPHPSSVLK